MLYDTLISNHDSVEKYRVLASLMVSSRHRLSRPASTRPPAGDLANPKVLRGQ